MSLPSSETTPPSQPKSLTMVRRSTETELQDLQLLVDRLQTAHTRDSVTLCFKPTSEFPNGRMERGFVTFVPRLGSGRIIDVERKFSLDYNIHDLASVDFQGEAT